MKILGIPETRKSIRQKVKEPFITMIYGKMVVAYKWYFNFVNSIILGLFSKCSRTVIYQWIAVEESYRGYIHFICKK